MRIVLVGTRTFGRTALGAVLAAGHDVALVSSPLDDPVMHDATRLGLPWVPALDAAAVLAADADVALSAHSHQFLGQRTRAATRLGALVYHPSLLPRHRGKDAVRWTVHLKDPTAGGTVFWADSGVDTGPVAAQDWCFVDPHWDASDLWRERLFPIGIRLILAVLGDLDRGRLVAVPQDEAYATWEPSWERPPLYRPELPQIGSGPNGFEVIAHRDDPRLHALA